VYISPFALVAFKVVLISCVLGVLGWFTSKVLNPHPAMRCPRCKLWPGRLVYMLPDDLIAMRTERGEDRETAKKEVFEILTATANGPNAGPSGLKLILRCRRCKSFFERKVC